MHKKIGFTLFIFFLLAVFAGCSQENGSGSAQSTAFAASSTPTTTAVTTSNAASSSSLSGIEQVIESIYNRTDPSVVSIQVNVQPSLLNPSGAELGSGFVWDTNGNIVTNNHVVSGATRMSVTFFDGTVVPATLVGTDSDSDLAVIKVSTNEIQLHPVTMGDSTRLKVGQIAVAIGNPFGLQNTMTVGFVSGLGRLLPADVNATGPGYSIPDVIQTDAAINPGNSGGVLLDSSGNVIGVTSSIATTSGTSSGVGFAIPSAIVQQVVPSLITTGHYDHPYLGVSITSLDPDINAAMNLAANQRGALVVSVTSGGPADKAGLLAGNRQITINGQQVTVGGDVIIAYDGQTVKSSDDLVTFLARSGVVGQAAKLTVLRNGQQMEISVTIGVRPVTPPAATG